MKSISTSILIVAALALGIVLGVGIYEHLFHIPSMLRSQEALNQTMKQNPNVPFFWIPLHAIIFISLLVGFIVNRKTSRHRKLLIVFGAYIFVSLISIPFAKELFRFAEVSVSASEFTLITQRWITLSWVRPLIFLTAQVLLLVTIATPVDKVSHKEQLLQFDSLVPPVSP